MTSHFECFEKGLYYIPLWVGKEKTVTGIIIFVVHSPALLQLVSYRCVIMCYNSYTYTYMWELLLYICLSSLLRITQKFRVSTIDYCININILRSNVVVMCYNAVLSSHNLMHVINLSSPTFHLDIFIEFPTINKVYICDQKKTQNE